MTLSLLLGTLVPAAEVALPMALAIAFAAMAVHGPETTPVPEAVTTEAVFATHGWV